MGIIASTNGTSINITPEYHHLKKSFNQCNSLSLDTALINAKHGIISGTNQELCKKTQFHWKLLICWARSFSLWTSQWTHAEPQAAFLQFCPRVTDAGTYWCWLFCSSDKDPGSFMSWDLGHSSAGKWGIWELPAIPYNWQKHCFYQADRVTGAFHSLWMFKNII